MNPGDDSFIEDIEGGQEGGDGGQQQQTTTTTTVVPNDDLKASLAELAQSMGKMAANQQQQQTASAALPSQDEVDKYWAIYKPGEETLRKFMRLNPDMDKDEAKAAILEYQGAFGEMQSGLVKQAVVGAQRLFQEELRKLREEYAPIQEHYATQRAEATKDRFFKTFESLSDPRYSRVIDASARLLADKTFTDEKAYFQALAESAAEAIKGLIPTFDLGAKTTKSTATTPRLPRTSVGGTGGSGGGEVQLQQGASRDDSQTLNW